MYMIITPIVIKTFYIPNITVGIILNYRLILNTQIRHNI